MSKPSKIKITGPKTCRAVYQITKSHEHLNRCPIIMPREKWELIEGMVMREKRNPTQNKVEDIINNMFSDFFK